MDSTIYDRIVNCHPICMKNNMLDVTTTVSTSQTNSIRLEYANILIAVMKLLKGSESEMLPFMNFLLHSYYCWLPDYFFITPASSTGKYHPGFANKPNGLMLHSLAVARYTDSFCDFLPDLSIRQRNTLVCAAWLHDMFKYGNPFTFKAGIYTDHGHPAYAADFFLNDLVTRDCLTLGLTQNEVLLMSDVIKTHMGPFTTSKHSNVVLEKPKTILQNLLFKADYFASRKENDIVKDLLP